MMPKYGDDEDMLNEALKGAGAGGISPPVMYKKRYPGQTRPLPSDEESIMESNKDRQDREAKEFAKKVIKGLVGGPTGLAAEAISRKVSPYAKGGKVKSASSRADGIAKRGKTRGRFV